MGRIHLLITVALCGCGDVRSETPDATEVIPGSFTLAVKTQNAPVPLDGQAHVGLEITRAGSFTGPVTIAGLGLPGGVTVTPVTIAAGATTGEVTVGGAAPLAINDKVTYTLQGTGDGVDPHTATITDALVTGKLGALDGTFGAGATGIAKISFGADDGGRFLALDVVNGSVVATGSGDGGLGQVRMSTTRFTAAGDVDATWAGGTLVRSSFTPTTSNDFAEAVATGRQADGRSIIIGTAVRRNQTTAPCPCTPDIGVIRYSLTGGSGGVDFGNTATAGTSLIDLGGDEEIGGGVVMSDSSIIAVGSKDGQFVIAQMTPSGLLDTAGFAAPTGFERLVVNDSSKAVSVVADATNHIVVAANFVKAGASNPFLVRYNRNGAHDATFGAAGQVVAANASGETAVRLRTASDKLVLASQANGSSNVRRYNADGSLDMTFGTAGVTDVPVANLRDMIVSPDGSIVLLGAVGNNGVNGLLVRLTASGAVDTLFGSNGDGTSTIFIGDSGEPRSLGVYSEHQIMLGGGDNGGSPGPGTFGILARIWN